MRSARGEADSSSLTSGITLTLVELRCSPANIAGLLLVFSAPARYQVAVVVVVMAVVFGASAVWLGRADTGVVKSTAHSKVIPKGPDDGNSTVNTSNGSLMLLAPRSPPPLVIRDGRSTDGVNRPPATSSLEAVLVADEGRLPTDILSGVILQAGGLPAARECVSPRLRALVAGTNTAAAAAAAGYLIDCPPLSIFLRCPPHPLLSPPTEWNAYYSTMTAPKELLSHAGRPTQGTAHSVTLYLALHGCSKRTICQRFGSAGYAMSPTGNRHTIIMKSLFWATKQAWQVQWQLQSLLSLIHATMKLAPVASLVSVGQSHRTRHACLLLLFAVICSMLCR